MKIKTNIYHVTGDNNEKYEDFTGYSTTIHAKNASEAALKGLKKLREAAGGSVYNTTVDLIFENVEMDAPEEKPIVATIGEVDFEFNPNNGECRIGIGGELFGFNREETRQIADFFLKLPIFS